MHEKTWHLIIVRSNIDHGETVAARLTDITGLGTEIRDSDNPLEPSTITAYLAGDDPALPEKMRAIRDFLEGLARSQPGGSPPVMVIDTIPEEDWDRKWREGLKPFHLTRRIVIRPSWETYQAEAGELVIEMDPGQAFGTGLHASTRLIVELLEEALTIQTSPPASVLDVGTGTGILAICAVLLGCGKATGIDIDPVAIGAARTNIAANHLEGVISATNRNLDELAGPYNLIMANIIHNTLVEMAPKLSTLLAPNGLLLLSGILRGGQAENIAARYAAHGLGDVQSRESGEWAAISLRKR